MNEKEFLTKIGERIKAWRKKRKMEQQDLAAACNFEKSNMSRIEAGGSNMTFRTLLKISKALNIKVKELVDVE
ncbi:helix-turn-helix domain-containing protein [Bacteroides acidifaciens]|uniref:helix-turn-helix domain-containing protein n=1 Tax=Bacteroides acidifaciens TaxID=85831 RepID=UPI00272C29AE|nr:helix-turn-helix transcriptional regulator [Bacteroides acidifaciens]